jgi:sugar phosphate isomerase/epimerase
MNSGVCSYCFNKPFLANEISVLDAIRFVGTGTEAACYEPLSRYWDPERNENEQASEAKDLMDEVGLTTSCYTLDSDFAVYDDAASAECIALCVSRLETTKLLGADRIRLDPRTSLPKDAADTDFDDVLEKMALSMQAIADEAHKEGLVVGVENHGRHLGRVAQTAHLVNLVDRENFGVNLDPTNFRVVFGEDHIEATRQLAEHVVHFHIKDIQISPTEMPESDGWRQSLAGDCWIKNAVGGTGDADWPTLFGIVKDAGYDGTISLEVVDPKDIEGSIREGVSNINKVILALE